MRNGNSRIDAAGMAALFSAAMGTSALYAQQTPSAPAPKITPAMKQDLETPGKEGVMSFVEFAPGAAEVPHSHPAELFVFVREGEVSLESEGKPTTTYKVGEVFYVAPGKVHRVSNNTGATSRTVAVFFTEKGKPLTTPAK